MNEKTSTDWWMWQMYRQVAHLINEPSDACEARLKALISEYRRFHEIDRTKAEDPHEWAMDYC